MPENTEENIAHLPTRDVDVTRSQHIENCRVATMLLSKAMAEIFNKYALSPADGVAALDILRQNLHQQMNNPAPQTEVGNS